MGGADEWAGLFWTAFRESRNAMVLLDGRRIQVDANGAYLELMGYRLNELVGRSAHHFVVGGPVATVQEWQAALREGHFTGEAELIRGDGGQVKMQWAATAEVVTGRRLVLFVALSTSRWGRRFRRAPASEEDAQVLSAREREVVRLVAAGNTGPEIADELRIAHDTVRTHARNAMAKVGARSRAHLVAKALAEGHVWD